MKFSVAVAAALTAVTEAHYTFPSITVGSTNNGLWSNVRKTTNWQSNGPMTDVTSSQMTCYQLAAGSEGATTVSVAAGSVVNYNVGASVSHPGNLAFYMAKVPAGQTAATYDGTGANWFKIYNDAPAISSTGLTWATVGKTSLPVTIPSCLSNGDYLLRVEHAALHTASSVGGAQYYISCAQITVTGGTGTANPATVSIPGAFTASDPGVLINLYYPIPTSYTPPGPKPMVC